jgi:drug/metabolite transporter (DMT)-like permease
MWVIALLLLITFEAIADILSKEYSLHGTFLYWSLALSGYIIANIFWLISIRKGSGLARGAILFSVGSAIAAVLIGALSFQEKIGKVELVGIVVGILSVVLIFWSDLVALIKS